MNNFIITMLITCCSFFVPAFTVETQGESKQVSFTWDSPEGKIRTQTMDAGENVWKLAGRKETQIRKSYCGIASTVNVLNALGIEAPKSTFLGDFYLFTQEEFFNDRVRTVITPEEVEANGIFMTKLTEVLKLFPLKVTPVEALTHNHEELRALLIEALINPKQAVLARYGVNDYVVGQRSKGHWSPIAAYDSASDSFLVMEVSSYRSLPFWIEASALLSSMQTLEISDGQPRGFIIVEKG